MQLTAKIVVTTACDEQEATVFVFAAARESCNGLQHQKVCRRICSCVCVCVCVR